MTMAEHCRLWRYRVAPEQQERFLADYSGGGSWAMVFGKAEGYLGTELWRDESDPDVFYTIDRWKNRAAFSAFESTYEQDYRELDRQFDALSKEEVFLGAGDAV